MRPHLAPNGQNPDLTPRNFSGLYVAVWYMAMSGMAEADFTGALAKAPVPLLYSLAYLGLGLVLAAAAMARERLQAT